MINARRSELDHLENYESYKGLPPLAGLCSMREAAMSDISVDECVRRLKRLHFACKRLHQIFISRITAEPVYELKMAYSLHGYLLAEHTASLRKRVTEMREPPLGLEDSPDANLEVFFDELQCAPTTEALVQGIYGVALPAIVEAFDEYVALTNRLVDAPSVRVCRFASFELRETLDYGRQAITCLIDSAKTAELSDWTIYLGDLLQSAGNLLGDHDADTKTRERRYSQAPYVYDPRPRRDDRFKDSYNAGVNAESFLYNDRFPANAKTLMMFYKRLREIDVPEMMTSILQQTPDKPWDYYVDMSRQIWDEARHAMIGELGFASVGIDWRDIPINFTWSLNINTQLEPLERHAVLFFIEQGLMPKTGKRYEWEVAQQSGDPLATLIQDFDWADEVLHAAIGRRWFVSQMPSLQEALRFGDQCWTRVVSDWLGYRDRGLTQHRNWWPELYRAACARWRIAPDPAALAFNETYEAKRADLQQLPGASG